MSKNTANRLDRQRQRRWVKLADLTKVNRGISQRSTLDNGWVAWLADNFDAEQFGIPEVSLRDDTYWIVEGAHRIEAARSLFGDTCEIEVDVMLDADEAKEARAFVSSATKKAVTAYDKFAARLQYDAPAQDINRIVMTAGLLVSNHEVPGAVDCVTALERIYKMGTRVLADTLRVVRDAYGDAGLNAKTLPGIALVINRYGPEIDQEHLISALAKVLGGHGGLISMAYASRQKHGASVAQNVASVAVDIYNRGLPRTKKLTSWWKEAK